MEMDNMKWRREIRKALQKKRLIKSFSVILTRKQSDVHKEKVFEELLS